MIESTFQPQPAGDLLAQGTYTQGGHKHLVQYLWDAYAAHLEAGGGGWPKARHAPGRPIAEAKRTATAVDFVRWATTYLQETRPLGSFFIDGNVGLRLTTGETVAVSPGVVVSGTMQESYAVPVTEGLSQPGNNGVVQTDGVTI